MDLAGVADELYALTPEEFTGTRNERAKEAKAEDKDLSNRIKALPKPSTAAWVVNMLARNQADLLEQVLSLGEALRQAQEKLEGDELRELGKQRRQLTAAVTSQARAMAADLGVKVSTAVADQVEETLRAAMTDPGAAKAVRTGQLLEALSSTGLGELDVSSAVAVPEAIGMTARRVERKKPDLKVVPPKSQASAQAAAGQAAAGASAEPATEEARKQDAEQARAQEAARAREAAQLASDEAEAAATKARKKLDKHRKRVSKLEARSLQIQGELDELRRKASELEYQLEEVDDELSEAEEKRDRAEQRQAEADAAAEEAREALAELAEPAELTEPAGSDEQ